MVTLRIGSDHLKCDLINKTNVPGLNEDPPDIEIVSDTDVCDIFAMAVKIYINA